MGTQGQAEYLGELFPNAVVTSVTLTLGTDVLFSFDGVTATPGPNANNPATGTTWSSPTTSRTPSRFRSTAPRPSSRVREGCSTPRPRSRPSLVSHSGHRVVATFSDTETLPVPRPTSRTSTGVTDTSPTAWSREQPGRVQRQRYEHLCLCRAVPDQRRRREVRRRRDEHLPDQHRSGGGGQHHDDAHRLLDVPRVRPADHAHGRRSPLPAPFPAASSSSRTARTSSGPQTSTAPARPPSRSRACRRGRTVFTAVFAGNSTSTPAHRQR